MLVVVSTFFSLPARAALPTSAQAHVAPSSPYARCQYEARRPRVRFHRLTIPRAPNADILRRCFNLAAYVFSRVIEGVHS